jgi:hypothetical protein
MPGVETWRVATYRHAKRAWPRHEIIPVKWFNLAGKCSSGLRPAFAMSNVESVKIYTIGHSTRPLEALIALLSGAAVDLLVDVRAFPRSRSNPQFNAETLADALTAAEISYRHIDALGGRRGIQQLGGPSPNTAWRETGFRNYADYALSQAFREGLDDLMGLARAQTCAVMCAEAVWWRCHRRIIADYLLASGGEVLHILGPGKAGPARLTPGAVVRPDGAVHYPGNQGELF